MDRNFPNLIKTINSQTDPTTPTNVKCAFACPQTDEESYTTHIISNLLKNSDKKEIWKQLGEHTNCKGTKIMVTDFSLETLWMSRQWNNMFEYWKKKNNPSTFIVHLAKIYFKYEGEIKNFSKVEKLKEFITADSHYKKKMLKGEERENRHWAEEKWQQIELWVYRRKGRTLEMATTWVNTWLSFLLFTSS